MEQRDLFDEPYPVPVCFLQLVGKLYPLEAVRTLGKKKKRSRTKNSLQTEPTWGHKALFGTDSILCARCKSILWEAPEKRAYQPEERLARKLNMERSNFVFDRQPDAFRSGRAHQRSDQRELSAHNH